MVQKLGFDTTEAAGAVRDKYTLRQHTIASGLVLLSIICPPQETQTQMIVDPVVVLE